VMDRLFPTLRNAELQDSLSDEITNRDSTLCCKFFETYPSVNSSSRENPVVRHFPAGGKEPIHHGYFASKAKAQLRRSRRRDREYQPVIFTMLVRPS